MTGVIQLTPIVHFTREANVGERYLLEVDLEMSSSGWAFDSEEIAIECVVNASPWFYSQPIDDGDVVLHRYGGSYGPAQFLLTASDQVGKGKIYVKLVNPQGVTMRRIKLDVKVGTDYIPTQIPVPVPIPPMPTPPPLEEAPTRALKLFTCYSSRDAAKVDAIVTQLENIRRNEQPLYSVWQDKKSIVSDRDWWDVVVDAMIECDVFIFYVSRESVKNEVCRAELSYAVGRNRFIIPVVLEGEYIVNSRTGRPDIDYWNNLPRELSDRQILFYEETSSYAQLERAMDEFRRFPDRWRDLKAPRPRDPREQANQLEDGAALYEAAFDYAYRLDFETANRLFRRLMSRGNPDFQEQAYEWIDLLSQYELLIEMDASLATQSRLPQLWNRYKEKFPKDFLEGIFDPKDFASRLDSAEDAESPDKPLSAEQTPEVQQTPVQPTPEVQPMTDREAFNGVVSLLSPFMANATARQALVQSALFGCRVLNQIDWSGNSNTFTVHLVQTLRNFGQCERGRPSIVMLLEELKNQVGNDQQATIDRFIRFYSPDVPPA